MYMHPGVYIEHVPCLLWGFVGLWQRALQMIDNFKQTIIGGIQDFVINSLIMGGLSWLAGLSNPVGAVIKIALAIYNLIKTFLERLDQILDVAKSIFSSIGAIAAGRIREAADFMEKTMAATMPVVISFLAVKADRLKPQSQKDNQVKGFAALEAELKEAATELQEAGIDTANYPEIDTEHAKYLFRAKEPRFDDIGAMRPPSSPTPSAPSRICYPTRSSSRATLSPRSCARTPRPASRSRRRSIPALRLWSRATPTSTTLARWTRPKRPPNPGPRRMHS